MLQVLQSVLYTLGSLAAGVLLQTSCTVVTPPSDGGDDNSNTPAQKITVRMVNQSAAALDPQLYASSQALGDPETTLFVAGNLQTAGVGFAGGGILQPATTDEVVLDCTAAQAIGTRGGRFLNVDSGAELGTGQQRFAGIGSAYNCGDTVTLTYKQQGTGYATSLSID